MTKPAQDNIPKKHPRTEDGTPLYIGTKVYFAQPFQPVQSYKVTGIGCHTVHLSEHLRYSISRVKNGLVLNVFINRAAALSRTEQLSKTYSTV